MQTESESVEKPKPYELVNGEITFPSSKQFKDLMQLLSDNVSDELVFRLDQEGLHLTQMEATRVSMILLDLPTDGADEFLCTEPGLFSFDVSYMLKRALKRV